MTAGLEHAFERIGEFLELRLPTMHAAGAALAVTDREEILGAVVRGFADAASGTPVRAETRFQIGSISKSFAAIVAVQLAEAGELDLHVPVTELVPWLELQQPFGPITMHHLLSHTSGLPIGHEEVASGLGAAWRLRDRAPGFPPGERFWYSNDGYKLVGVVLEHVTGRPVHEVIRERLLEPLGMKHTVAAITDEVRADEATGYTTMYDDRPPYRDHPLVEAEWIVCNTADGSIVADVIDMSAYMRLLLNRCDGVLSEDGFLKLTDGVIDAEYPGFRYGYGLNVAAGRAMLRHSGGMPGFTALMMVDMEAGIGGIVLLNGFGEQEPIVRFALQAVRAALDGEELPAVTPPADPAETPDAAVFAGAYQGDGRRVELVAEGTRLGMVEDAWSVILERYESGDAFLVPDRARDTFLVTFARDDDGRVVELRHGADVLFREGVERPALPTPPSEWLAYTGHYRGPGLWEGSFRVVLRGGRLWKISPNAETEEYDLPLVPLPDGSFRIGDEDWRPDFISFDSIVEGKAARAVANGTAWYRWFTD